MWLYKGTYYICVMCICTPNAMSKGRGREAVPSDDRKTLYACGCAGLRSSMFCLAAVEQTLNFLEGGRQPFSCGSLSSSEIADVNFKPNSLILVIGVNSNYCL